MCCPPAFPPILVNQKREDTVRTLFNAAVKATKQSFKAPPQIVWMINPVADAMAYCELKLMPDKEAGVGIVSQCLISKHIDTPMYSLHCTCTCTLRGSMLFSRAMR
ncbi:hypothetical protein PsorP6_001690 [Peronosclerospora sorghi]|uniref:Uncharacterized protein n=1 Tax=Peronosclerospora sorghi TaxID=230839 RepID=A0ACC0WQP5_9STRA|nr:hypothetical protein PsorP6_001690 [Peronosclerospora sorghi]